LLNTIRIPKNLHYLTERLPKPNYSPLKLKKLDKQKYLQTLSGYKEFENLDDSGGSMMEKGQVQIQLPKLNAKNKIEIFGHNSVDQAPDPLPELPALKESKNPKKKKPKDSVEVSKEIKPSEIHEPPVFELNMKGPEGKGVIQGPNQKVRSREKEKEKKKEKKEIEKRDYEKYMNNIQKIYGEVKPIRYKILNPLKHIKPKKTPNLDIEGEAILLEGKPRKNGINQQNIFENDGIQYLRAK